MHWCKSDVTKWGKLDGTHDVFYYPGGPTCTKFERVAVNTRPPRAYSSNGVLSPCVIHFLFLFR
jgi:hypothetical protein